MTDNGVHKQCNMRVVRGYMDSPPRDVFESACREIVDRSDVVQWADKPYSESERCELADCIYKFIFEDFLRDEARTLVLDRPEDDLLHRLMGPEMRFPTFAMMFSRDILMTWNSGHRTSDGIMAALPITHLTCWWVAILLSYRVSSECGGVFPCSLLVDFIDAVRVVAGQKLADEFPESVVRALAALDRCTP